jgi:hypothetical protein
MTVAVKTDFLGFLKKIKVVQKREKEEAKKHPGTF